MRTFMFLFSFLLIFIFSGSSILAQDGNIVYIQTWEFEMPEGGSFAEFDSLSTLVTKNVDSKNEKILSQRVVRHLWGSDSRQLIVIREYASLEDLMGDDNSNELFEAAWKTEEERKAFGEAYGKYWQGRHSDEIYQEFSGARKK